MALNNESMTSDPSMPVDAENNENVVNQIQSIISE